MGDKNGREGGRDTREKEGEMGRTTREKGGEEGETGERGFS